MISLICFCAYKWLWYLLSGLLGLFLGWLLWGYLKKLVSSLEDENRSYRSRITQLENEASNRSTIVDTGSEDLRLDLENSLKKRAELEGELAIAYGRIREMEAGTVSTGSSTSTHITNISGSTGSSDADQFLSVPLHVSEDNEDPVFDNAAEIIDLKNKIAVLQDREHDLNAEVNDLRNKIAVGGDSAHDLSAEVNDLRNALAVKSDRELDLAAELNDLKNKIAISGDAISGGAIVSGISSASSSSSSSSTSSSGSKKKSGKPQNPEEHIEDLELRLRTAQRQNADLLTKISSYKDGTLDSESESTELAQDLDNEKSKVLELQEQLNALTLKYDEAVAANEASVPTADETESSETVQHLNQELDYERTKVNDLQNQLNALNIKYEEAKVSTSTDQSTSSTESDDTTEALNLELEEQKARVRELENQMHALKYKYDEVVASTKTTISEEIKGFDSTYSSPTNIDIKDGDSSHAASGTDDNDSTHGSDSSHTTSGTDSGTDATSSTHGSDGSSHSTGGSDSGSGAEGGNDSSHTAGDADSGSGHVSGTDRSSGSGSLHGSSSGTGDDAKGTSEKVGLHGAAGSSSGHIQVGSSGIASDKFGAIDKSNLQIIEGIGPAMEKLYKENGISNVSDMASKSDAELQAILDKYGDKYRIIDPKTWNDQAVLAHEDKWEELIAYQKTLVGGKKGNAGKDNDSKVEKVMVKLKILKKWKHDDLKAIEGIGPKIAGLLMDAGINTWLDLSKTSEARLQEILDKAGKRYALANPSTWAEQAKLAAEGRFAELDKLQDELDGGRR